MRQPALTAVVRGGRVRLEWCVPNPAVGRVSYHHISGGMKVDKPGCPVGVIAKL